ncbi:MAG: ATP-binding cassette domain-containing protein [Actinobacteria bacterium]|nr:ATP-binding cassette domain-containing protein [Actinomycetota bacterium]
MLEVAGLTKRFGAITAVDQLAFQVRPGVVTGFLGPNGSGKSTTMRCMLDLDRPDAGTTSFNGRRYRDLDRPLHEVGSLLDAGYVHPGRSGRNHLRWLAASNGIGRKRVDEVLELVGLTSVGGTRVRGYSLGMKQRLGLAGVLLGDPHTVILDEPANGLDPEGIRWIRDVLTHLAGQGRTVLVSSHQLSEMALMADDLVVIGQGRLIEQSTVKDFIDTHAERWVRVQSPALHGLAAALTEAGAAVTTLDPITLEARGVECAQVGELAARLGIVLHELSPQTGSLEDAFLQATASAQVYRSADPFQPPAVPQ